MCETVGEDVAETVEVVLEGGAVPALLFRLGFEATDGRLQRLDVLPQRRVLLLVLGGRFPQLSQLRLPNFVVVEKLFGKDGNVERTDLVSGSVGAVTSGIVTPITVLLLLVLLPGLHVLYNVQLRVVALNLLNVLLRLDLAVRRVRCRLLL